MWQALRKPCGHVCCFSVWLSAAIIKRPRVCRGFRLPTHLFINPVWWKQLKNQQSQFIPFPPWWAAPGPDARSRVTTMVSFLHPNKVGRSVSVSLQLPEKLAPISPAAQSRPIVVWPNRVRPHMAKLFRKFERRALNIPSQLTHTHTHRCERVYRSPTLHRYYSQNKLVVLMSGHPVTPPPSVAQPSAAWLSSVKEQIRWTTASHASAACRWLVFLSFMAQFC